MTILMIFSIALLLLQFSPAGFPPIAGAETLSASTAGGSDKKSGEEAPEVWMTPEEDIKKIPGKDDRSWLNRNKWWVALSVILTGGIIAAATAGSTEDDSAEKIGGSYTNTW
jgi:hypothetical protein